MSFNISDYRYLYNVDIRSIYDGDTVRVDIDLGFGFKWTGDDGRGVSLRLFGLNTPEVRGEERERGLASKQALIDFIGDGKVMLQTVKDQTGKYGRYLAILHLESLNESGEISYININEWLIENGWAERKDY